MSSLQVRILSVEIRKRGWFGREKIVSTYNILQYNSDGEWIPLPNVKEVRYTK